MGKSKPTGKMVTFSAKWKRTTFPASGLGVVSTYGITKWQLTVDNSEIVTSDSDSQLVTVIGDFNEPIIKNIEYIITAEEVENRQYGTQYQLLFLSENIDITTPEKQQLFLAGCGLTPKQIQALYDTLSDPFNAIKNKETSTLMKVKGIGQATAERIINRFNSGKDKGQVFIELATYGFTQKFIDRLLKTYGSQKKAIEIIKTNPYDLIYRMDRVGFLTADKIALKGNLDKKSKDRIAAFFFYYLTTQAEEHGNSYIYTSELNQALFNALGDNIRVDYEGGNNIKDAIESLIANELIVVEEASGLGLRRVYLKRIYDLEKEIAQHLIRLKEGANQFKYDDWEVSIDLQEQRQGFKFSQEQKDGIKMGLDNQVCVIAGLAGTGKSALVAGILSALPKYKFAQCALSGKAAARLQEVTGKAGYTIHKLIMKGGFDPETGFFHCHDQSDPIPYDIIILDEISMVSGDIFLKLLRAIPTGAKLIMLGDPGQLEPVGILNIATDLIASEHIPSITLTHVHRQALDSGIISSAYSVRNKIALFPNDFYGPMAVGVNRDMLFVMQERLDIRESITDYFKKAFESEIVGRDINNIMLISPVKTRGDSCVKNINQDIQDIYNPVLETESRSKLLIIGDEESEDCVKMHKGDKVMCIKNNYETPLAASSGNIPIYNGWMGTIIQIDPTSVIIKFALAESPVLLTKDLAREIITLGYCSTCHKLQGSDAPFIIGVVDYSTPPSMLTNALLYTLITRAKKRCVILGETAAFNLAVSQEFVSTKRTFLQEFLEKIDIPY